jgi:nitrite reductase/ring-hydroxylating ferredoxin subunit
MRTLTKTEQQARFEGLSYQDILDRDSRTPPDSLRAQCAPYLGSEPVPAAHYTSRARFDLEVDKMWLHVWQMACREEEIPAVGDYMTYEIAGRSLLVVRSAPDRIQAFHNTCLHRGRKLAVGPGCSFELRCPFHGFAWHLDGSFKSNPFPWDFQHLEAGDLTLPEVRVGLWGGFVFINFDPQAPELVNIIAPLEQHFRRWRPEERYISFHVAKVIRCNWKVASEAFMESHHTLETHPQLMVHLADVNSQYDVFSDYVTRQISANGVASPHLGDVREQEIADALTARRADGAKALTIPEGGKARAALAERVRQSMSAADGHDYTQFSDAEMLDSILYNVFPNFSVWGGVAKTRVYRWRPNGDDVHSSIMEVYGLAPVAKGRSRPQPAPLRVLSDAERWSDAAELGGLGFILDQDMGNLPYVQEGLVSSGNNKVHFANYQEMRIRQHHVMIQRYIDTQR